MRHRAMGQQSGSLVAVDVHFGGLAPNVEVVRKFALEPLGALASLVILAQHGLGIHTCSHHNQLQQPD